MSNPYRKASLGGPSPKRARRQEVDLTSPPPCRTPIRNPYSPKADNDVQVVSRPAPAAMSMAVASMPNDDEVVVQSSNATNANVVYPHARPDCGVYSFETTKSSFCTKCYCVVCNVEASKCQQWSVHCIATKSKSSQETEDEDDGEEDGDDTIELDSSPLAQQQRNAALFQQMGIDPRVAQIHELMNPMAQAHYARMEAEQYYAERRRYGGGGEKKGRHERDMRITEVFQQKLDEIIKKKDASSTAHQKRNQRKMEGDISQLVLQKSFFVEGVRIGWPFPVIMAPQRQMAIHLIKALKKKLHVVLESPTGTGKSAAILCSVLAWQRYHTKTMKKPQNESDAEETPPKIIYGSRTHSQVAQMIASLKKTPYRPRMAVLGSRDRLCIHKEIVNRDGKGQSRKDRVNVNQVCQVRVGNTEKIRKALWRSHDFQYDDENPPLEFPGDADGSGGDAGVDAAQDDDEDIYEENVRSSNWILKNSTKKLTCPHYRQLSTKRNAYMVGSKFVYEQSKIDCCSAGGEQTKLGVHDIEDLVRFGVNPYVDKDVAIYRDGGAGSFGMILQEFKQNQPGVLVNEVVKNGAADKEGTVKQNDRLLAVQGGNVLNARLDQVTEEVRNTDSDPLLLDVLHGGDVNSIHDADTYSSRSACPYYLSRALSKHAELIFAPYNYVLDPQIRKSLDIDLSGAVVVLDEAHNVEDTLKESGSGKFGEVEMCEILALLSFHASASSRNGPEISVQGIDVPVAEVAHEVLLFVEKLVFFMRKNREAFEQSPGKMGAGQAIQEYERFHLHDDHEWEVTYDGPNGYGVMNKAVGCKPFFDKIAVTEAQVTKLQDYAQALASHLNGNKPEEESGDGSQAQGSTILDRMSEIVSKFSFAMLSPEHFYVSCISQANGSLDFAGDLENDAAHSRSNRFKKKPKALPFARPRSARNPDAPLPVCLHKSCRSGNYSLGHGTRHGDFCDGSTKKWETHLVLKLLSPGVLMENISKQCRSVVLASGTLAPIPSLCGELNLFPPKAQNDATKPSLGVKAAVSIDKEKEDDGRLQVVPKPLEANHVIDLKKQLFAVGIGEFPDGSPLTVTYSHYKNKEFFVRLGKAIATVVECIPRGGVLIFFPSYSFLRNCVKCWNPGPYENEHECPEVWDSFLNSKGKVVVEPSGSQEKFEKAKADYANKIKRDGNCILLAVFRGKMSEGISFNDDNARGVICVGLPLPNSFDRPIKAKMVYNDEQRKLHGRNSILPGREWYTQQAYRAIAQALGRCIRHAADYGTVVLMDSRHCSDGSPCNGVCREHQNLPKWMRNEVRTLKVKGGYEQNGLSDFVMGGYRGLSDELKNFFAAAPAHSQAVIEKWRKDLETARENEKQSSGHTFNTKTGIWSEKSAKKGRAKKAPVEKREAKKNPERKAKATSPFFKTTQDSPQVRGGGSTVLSDTPESMITEPDESNTPMKALLVAQATPKSGMEDFQNENVPENRLPN